MLPAAASRRPLPPPCRLAVAAAAAMGHQPVAAQDDLPVLPSNFFNDPAQTGHWSWEADFQNVVEIGKGKVRKRRLVAVAAGKLIWVLRSSC